MESNSLIPGIITILIGVLATAVLGICGWVVVRVNGSVCKVRKKVDDHETRLAVVEVVLDRIDKNVEKLLEK
jgi:hypothetical protein